ncbi:MAG TPA: outer membrane protein assembly factor BamC [Pelomicrobium sp.]|nr:outer membrane protein assembly factor BamC [Pelomicrobium sp.]
MRRTATAILAVAAVLAGGCGGQWTKTDIDYKSQRKTDPLEVPPDLTAPSASDRYTVPESSARGAATYSAYSAERGTRPQSGVATLAPTETATVRIERAGSERWLVVNQPPEKVWPVVKNFWQELGFIIVTEIPDAGVMETDWAENRAKIPQDPVRNMLGKVLDNLYSTGTRDKFRTRLERVQDGKATEVYVSHRGMEEVLVGTNPSSPDYSVWQPVPADPGLEAEMLSRLMVRFGVEEQLAQAQVASAAGAAPQAKLTQGAGGGASQLALVDQFDRAWRRVGLALDRTGFTVEDRDRTNGIYFVRYAPVETQPKKEEGFLSKLAFWRSDDTGVRPEQYRVQVQPAEPGSRVNVLDKDGRPAQSETANRILSLLYDQLK